VSPTPLPELPKTGGGDVMLLLLFGTVIIGLGVILYKVG
jgi:LPXTG-motif cell wall-anchored protein